MRALLLNVIISILYLLLAKAGLLFALPLGYASIVWPAAGLACGMCIHYGWRRVWPGIALGAFLGNTVTPDGFVFHLFPIMFGVGSAIESALAAFLIRRNDPELIFGSHTAILRLIVAAGVSCLIGACCGNAALLLFTPMSMAQLPLSFISWWFGDSLGILIFMPCVLAALDIRPLWTGRRQQLGFPLLAASLLSALVYKLVLDDTRARWNRDFAREVDSIAAEMARVEDSSGRAVRLLASLYAEDHDRSANRFVELSSKIRNEFTTLQAMEYAPVVARQDQQLFETNASKELNATIAVTPIPGNQSSDPKWLAPISAVEPAASRSSILGRDLLSEPVRAKAIRKAWISGEVTASAVIRMVADNQGPGGMLVVAPFKDGGQIRGFVVGILNLRSIFMPLDSAPTINWSLEDQISGTEIGASSGWTREGIGHEGREREGIRFQRSFRIADRPLRLVMFKPYTAFVESGYPISYVVMMMAMVINASLVMFMLNLSATSANIRRQVQLRTQQLSEEIEHRRETESERDRALAQLEGLIEAAPVGVALLDLNGRFIAVNSTFAAGNGRSREQHLGQSFKDIHSVQLLPEIEAIFHQVLKTKRSVTNTELSDLPTNYSSSARVLSLSYFPVFDNNGEMSGVGGLIEDVSAQKRILKRLQESEQLLRLIADNTPGMLGYWTKDLICGFANRAYFEWFGRTSEQMLGINMLDLMGESLFKLNEPHIRAVLRGEDQQFERTLTKPNGEIGYTLARYIAHRVGQEIVGFFVLVSDITPIKQANEKLHKSEAYNRAIVEALPDLVLVIGRDGRVLSSHASTKSMLRASSQPLVDRNVFDVLPSVHSGKFLDSVHATLESQSLQELRIQLLALEQQDNVFEARLVPLDSNAVLCIVRDVSERERDRRNREHYTAQLSSRLQYSEAELRKQEQMLALAADAAGLGVWTYDISGNALTASESWYRMFGFRNAPVLTREDIISQLHPDDREGYAGQLAIALRNHGEYESNYRFILPDRRIRWMSSRGKVRLNSLGEPETIHGVTVDITERKEAELELEMKRSEVTYLSRLAMLGELSGALAHELNQPLMSILINAETALLCLKNGATDANWQELEVILREIVDQDNRAGQVIKHLRALFSKRETTGQDFDVNELVKDVQRMLGNDLLNRGILFKTEFEENLPYAHADKIQVEQVVINLILNACDAMKDVEAERRCVIVGTSLVADHQVQLSVIDFGPGVASDLQDVIFEAFFTTKEQGMGLGLSICKNIISAARGKIWVENNSQGGATFHFILPTSSEDLS